MDKKSNSCQIFKQHVVKQKNYKFLLQLVGNHILLLVRTLDGMCAMWGSRCARHCVSCATLSPVLYVLVLAVCKAVGTIWYTLSLQVIKYLRQFYLFPACIKYEPRCNQTLLQRKMARRTKKNKPNTQNPLSYPSRPTIHQIMCQSSRRSAQPPKYRIRE